MTDVHETTATMLHDLDHYGLSADRGFLSQRESDEVALPADFAEVEAAGAILPDLLTTGRVRHWLDKLPVRPTVEHPILINRPLVVSPLGVKLCRPSEAVLELLPETHEGPFSKEDGELIIDNDGRRVV